MSQSLRSREEIEQYEQEHLRPYATRAADSRGRVYAQNDHPLRTAFQRDRDRIIHSAAFRRMEYKTQVFIPHERDHFRTRLTHTIEVAQISRTLARNLGLNEDLAEAVALVHDLGHTPFGHSGEDVLDELLRDIGGFNHNRQSLRVVDILEQRYEKFPGLNLSYEVREGIVKHETKVKIDLDEFPMKEKPTLEASLVDIADEIAYNSHDIDDGVASGILVLDDLLNSDLIAHLDLAIPADTDDHHRRYILVRALVDRVATDVLQETSNRLELHGIRTIDDVRGCPEKLVGYSAGTGELVREFKRYLNANLYQSPKLKQMSDWVEEVISTLYDYFLSNPDKLPDRYRKMLSSEMIQIVVADYIAGMTDRYATQMVEQLHQP